MLDDLQNRIQSAASTASRTFDAQVTGRLDGFADSAAEKFDEITGGKIMNKETARAAMPWVAGAGVATAGLFAFPLVEKATKAVFSGIGSLLTGFGLFEKIPLIGGLFTGLREGLDTIGSYAAYGVVAALGFVAFKMFGEKSAPITPETDFEKAHKESAANSSAKLKTVGVIAAADAGIVAARLAPDAAKAGAAALSGAYPKAAGMIPEVVKNAGSAAAQVATDIGKNASDGLGIFKKVPDAAQAAAKPVEAAAKAVNATKDAIPLVEAATKTVPFLTKATHLLKAGSKFLGVGGGVVGEAFDLYHANELRKKGETGSAALQVIGGTAENVGYATLNPCAILGGTALRDTLYTADVLRTGKENMTRSVASEVVGTLGGDYLAQKTADLAYGGTVAEVNAQNQKANQNTRDSAAEERLNVLSPKARNEIKSVQSELAKDPSKEHDMLAAMGEWMHRKKTGLSEQEQGRISGLMKEGKTALQAYDVLWNGSLAQPSTPPQKREESKGQNHD